MTHPFDTLRYETGDHIATITLNRPGRLNAFTPHMADELIAAFDRADADDVVRAVIVTGAGRGFCAGADLANAGATFDYAARGVVAEEGHRDNGGRVALRIFEMQKPVIAAINGAAVGVGVTMTLPMDMRLASTAAKFGFVFTRRGIIPEAASSWFLPRLVGISAALEWTTTGRVFAADEAHARGLVRSLHAPEELLPAARALAREIAENAAPVSVALTRRMMWTMLGAEHPMRAHQLDSALMLARGGSGDAREGVAAFLDKRPAAFPDRVSADMPPWPLKPTPSFDDR